ncbi:MAG: rod shape-determining protein MreC, partial [Candidatus Xenobia bacterium]
GSAWPDPDSTIDVDGMAHGLPMRVSISANEIHEALKPALTSIADHVRDVLSELGPQLVADVTSPGSAVLVGGVARLSGMVPFLQQEANLSVQVPTNPELAVARGLEILLRTPALRRALLSAPSSARVPQAATHRSVDRGLATVLGVLSLLLVWQAAGPLVPRTPVIDRTLTAWLVPVWSTVSRYTSPPMQAPVALDPVQKRLLAQVRDQDRQLALLAAENHRLRGLLHMARGIPDRGGLEVAAQVVARDTNAWMQTLVLDAGRTAHVTTGMPVVSENGLVGRVAEVSDGSARVNTVSYHNATTAATIPARHTSGVVYGVDGRTCEMRYLDPNAGVRPGDVIMTNGLDGCPEGLTIGRVQSLRWGTDGVSQIAVVRPAVPLDTVRDVLVVGGNR